MAPAVFTDLPHDAEFSCEEVFGPNVAVWPVDDDDEAIERANGTTFDLSASIFTRDLDSAKKFVERINAGIVHVNSQTAGAEVHVPFGGLSGSGYGPHEQGRSAIEFYTQTKTDLPGPRLMAGSGSSRAGAMVSSRHGRGRGCRGPPIDRSSLARP